MQNGTITSAVSVSVTLGSASYADSLTVTGTGSILPASAGATGVYGGAVGDLLTNLGRISGASGGGIGVDLTGGTLVNAGTIIGGAGGAGGTGVELKGGVTVNYGSISGGSGAGVRLDGGILVGTGTVTAGTSGYAVTFGSTAGTLALLPGEEINGVVAANSAADDFLDLGGTAAATVTALGTQFTGFTTVVEEGNTHWIVAGANSLASNTILAVGGNFDVAGVLLDSGHAHTDTGGVLTASGGGALLVAALNLYGGTVSDSARGTLAVGTSLTGAHKGDITVQTGAQIFGAGTLVAARGDVLADYGLIAANAGTLVLASAVSGAGTLDIQTGATMHLSAGAHVGSVVFNLGSNETLFVGVPKAFISPITGFGDGDTIDLRRLKATSLGYDNGTLSLLGEHGHKVLDTLVFGGDYSLADFAIVSDGSKGTDVTYAPAGKRIPVIAMGDGGLRDVTAHAHAWPPDSGHYVFRLS
jgi:hypothetical protein